MSTSEAHSGFLMPLNGCLLGTLTVGICDDVKSGLFYTPYD